MITPAYFWLNVFLLAVGTFLVRFSVIALSGRITISARLKEIFSFIPAAVLPAFIAPAVFFHRGNVDWLAHKERLFILLVAMGVYHVTRSTLATVSFGLVCLYWVQ